MTCPFCKDDDFDAPGLKHHLSSGLCGSYNTTPGLRRAHRLVANVPPVRANCILNCDSPSYPPDDDERRQCGCAQCQRDLATR